MALNGNVLGALIKSNIDAAVAATAPNTQVSRTALFNAIGDAIVAHITANALVTVTVASVSGVTPGVGVSGTGAGTGTIS